MKWIEGKITTSSEALEAVGEMLSEAGISGFQIEDDYEMKKFLEDNPLNWDYVDEELLNKEASQPCLKFYVPENLEGREVLLHVKNGLARLKESDCGLDMGPLSMTLENVDDIVWLESWKKYYKPFQVGDKIVIRPTWEPVPEEFKDGKLILTINPGHVFGTGQHQSTRMCAEALETFVKPGQSVLDLGSGSGILGILAVMLGAKSATLVDIDPAAADIAYENAKLNGIAPDNFKALTGNAVSDEKIFRMLAEDTAHSGNKYDLVISNIVADVIISLAPVVAKLTARGGIYLSSGIIEERLDDVLTSLSQNGFKDFQTRSMDGWVGVKCVFS